MEEKKKEEKKKNPVSNKHHFLTREDAEMFQQDSYELKFYNTEDDRDE